MLLFLRYDVCYIDAISYMFHNFSLIWGIFWWCWWRFKSSGMLSCVSWYIVSQHFGGMWCLWLQSQAMQVLLLLLNPEDGVITLLWKFTECLPVDIVTSHNIWILLIFILIFWTDYRSVTLKTYYYIDTSQFEAKNIKYFKFINVHKLIIPAFGFPVVYPWWQTVDKFIISSAKFITKAYLWQICVSPRWKRCVKFLKSSY